MRTGGSWGGLFWWVGLVVCSLACWWVLWITLR